MMLVSTRDRFMIWAATFCFAAAVCLVSFLVCKKIYLKRTFLFAFITTLFIPVLIIPSVKQEFIHVSRNHITVEEGFWFRNSRTDLYFNDLDNIREVTTGPIPGNLLGDPDVTWHFQWKDGRTQALELNDFFNAHRMVVAHYIRDRGYRFELLEDTL